jgi:hypothetical protein
MIRHPTHQTTAVTAAASQLHLVVFRRQGSRFFRPKRPGEMLSGDRGASTSRICSAAALVVTICALAMSCNGDWGYSTPSGTGAASYRGAPRACARLVG